jgi:hypothetical protein
MHVFYDWTQVRTPDKFRQEQFGYTIEEKQAL